MNDVKWRKHELLALDNDIDCACMLSKLGG
jgi:hypothetical protein